MKKILIFSTAYYPFVGGAEVAVKEITDRINDIQFDMLTCRLDGQLPIFEKIGNVNVYRISGPKLLFPFVAFFMAKKLNDKNHYNFIWSIMASYGGFAALFFKIFHSEILFLLTLQEGDPIDYIKKKVWFVYPLFKRIFTRADFVQAISNYLGNWAREMGFRGPLEIVPNGVDLNKFKSQILPAGRQVSNLKNKENKILITTSRLVKKNAVGDIIEALRYLPENVKLLVLGIGPLEKELKSQALSIGLQDRVEFLGYISHKDLPEYFRVADIFIRPSLSEGLGSSFLEAMAAGLPVIGTPVGGIPDFLKDPSINLPALSADQAGGRQGSGQVPTGLFCEVNNPESIAEKVELLLGNDELRQKIIKNARELVIKNYDWDLIADKMKGVFEKAGAFGV
ncbi:glycosyltransferase family 4 protein [Patescibacteria group bacterium]|nr:glycosyltransferase family 4 protein [Patescibacteria group bacterium]